MSKYRVKLLYH